MSGAGQGGTSVGSGGAAGGGTATPSDGCGNGGRPSSPLNAVEAIITFPTAYDGSTPYPMIFGFHGAGRTNQQFREVDAKTSGGELEQSYVMVYLKSQGNDWTGALSSNYTRFDAAYTELTNEHCIDTGRVLAMGHSSGAQFISNLVCRPEPRLRGVAPVASSPYGQTCPGIPALIIHGKTDSERGNDGAQYVQQYVTRAGCSSATMPYAVVGCSSGGTQVDPGCVAYQECGENPVIWCSHNDPNYSGTNHGWPCFANDAILDFFATLQ
jgi:poly(3-hydroxybutyrate) depolymerase